MRRKLSALLLTAFATGCATAPPKVPPIAQTTSDSGCVALYSAGDQLGIVTTFKTNASTFFTLYNPSNGLMVNAPLFQRLKCNDVNVSKLIAHWPYPRARLHAVINPDAKMILDHARSAPQAAIAMIETNPPYLRLDNTWNNKLFIRIMNSFIDFPHEERRLDQALRKYSPSQVTDMIAAEEKRIAEERKLSNARVRELINKWNAAWQPWEQRLTAKYEIGDQVCTMKGNFYGNVEMISGERLKVHVIGQNRNAPDGFFFAAITEQPFEAIRVDAPRWFERDEIAHCKYYITR